MRCCSGQAAAGAFEGTSLLVTLMAFSAFLTLTCLWTRGWRNSEQLQTLKLGEKVT